MTSFDKKKLSNKKRFLIGAGSAILTMALISNYEKVEANDFYEERYSN